MDIENRSVVVVDTHQNTARRDTLFIVQAYKETRCERQPDNGTGAELYKFDVQFRFNLLQIVRFADVIITVTMSHSLELCRRYKVPVNTATRL